MMLIGFAAIILFGSVHLGWHYAIDGLVGGAMALGIWRLSGGIADRLIGSAQSDDLPTISDIPDPVPSIA